MKGLFFIISAISSLSILPTQASLFLYNDSAFPLTAVIVSASGATLGERTLGPQETGYFEDSLGGANPTATQPYATEPNENQYPIVPYTVIWNCMTGANYATCTMVSSGALSSPNQCQGPKYCQPQQQQQQNAPQATPSAPPSE